MEKLSTEKKIIIRVHQNINNTIDYISDPELLHPWTVLWLAPAQPIRDGDVLHQRKSSGMNTLNYEHT